MLVIHSIYPGNRMNFRCTSVSVYGVALTLWSLSSERCQAEVIRHDRELQTHRELADKPNYRCVAELQLIDSTEKRKSLASGVLVSPEWILTAAHVAKQGSVYDHRWKIDGRDYEADRRIYYPSFASDKDAQVLEHGWDIALVHLTEKVNDVRPARLYRDRDEVGQTATFVGHGVVGRGDSGLDAKGKRERLAGTNVLDSAGATVGSLEITDDVLLFDFDSPGQEEGDNYLGSAVPMELEVGGASGDSGGAVFVGSGDDESLAGLMFSSVPRDGDVDSPSQPYRGKYGEVGAVIRISSKIGWIETAMAQPLTAEVQPQIPEARPSTWERIVVEANPPAESSEEGKRLVEAWLGITESAKQMDVQFRIFVSVGPVEGETQRLVTADPNLARVEMESPGRPPYLLCSDGETLYVSSYRGSDKPVISEAGDQLVDLATNETFWFHNNTIWKLFSATSLRPSFDTVVYRGKKTVDGIECEVVDVTDDAELAHRLLFRSADNRLHQIYVDWTREGSPEPMVSLYHVTDCKLLDAVDHDAFALPGSQSDSKKCGSFPR